MHGLINRAVQSFVCLTYGRDRWQRVMRATGLDFVEFEGMLTYDDAILGQVLEVLRQELDRPLDDILEDIGTFLVSHPEMQRLRRLLRFSGETYVDFLHSLDDLPDRARLAISDLKIPPLDLREFAAGCYCLSCGVGLPGFGRVLIGVLRAMADDYGALVTLQYVGSNGRQEQIAITLVNSAFAAGRSFDLGARTA
ncbi:heme NO-binding domain-containing protein [Chachezhania sediminis]|uniref:heme NO-binding domain-containing protein n=1 Tax=Chachezhania sediminis TaxID=2599291 RepID=UPI00131BE2AC|nr:heme NO-binding domain-containing protein [Chachezhania sediminis]